MKFLNITLSILLVLSFLMIPTCAFAYGIPHTNSETITHSSSYLNNINPMMKSSSSSKVKIHSDDDSGDSTDDGSGSWIWIIIAIIVIALIIGVWYFLLRNR